MTEADKTIEAKVTHRFTVAPERVFDAWLDPEKIQRWMRTALRGSGLAGDIRRVEVDARVGGRFTFSDMRDDVEAVHWGRYLVIDRPHKLVFTWFTSKEDEQANNSTVTLTIEPEHDGCVATIRHEMAAEWADYVDRTEGGWARMLTAIDGLESGH
ncbi:SRPBCC family protein [Nonomuraea sp. NPDC046802]|uniref:SRPBCC family protein n=1 Tax=Nonomuraea sp. NPDC046802 TaxID=3154919 RepID=UPI0033EA1F5E